MPKFLFKANDDVLSFCQCSNEPAESSCQLDCPWCGCGWLFTCSKCHKAFTFAEVRDTDIPLIELGRREANGRDLGDLSEEEISEWAISMTESLDCFDVGDIVVYLDGGYWRVDSTNIEFTGLFAEHKLERLPHDEALADPSRLRTVLGDIKYWLSRERPDREQSGVPTLN